MFALYKLIGTPEQTQALREKYLAGNFGYGHAKQALFDLIIEKYKKEREAFNFFMSNPDELESKMKLGEAKARETAWSRSSSACAFSPRPSPIGRRPPEQSSAGVGN